MKAADEQKALAWIVGRDTGLSSESLWANMMGAGRPRYGWSYPHDPADIGRCFRLLKLIPAWRKRLPEMSKRHPVWRALVKHWDEIESCMDAEVGIDWSKGRSAPRTYNLMISVIQPVEDKIRQAA